jgi:hypothetical protein
MGSVRAVGAADLITHASARRQMLAEKGDIAMAAMPALPGTLAAASWACVIQCRTGPARQLRTKSC